jgi:hypothetical protein
MQRRHSRAAAAASAIAAGALAAFALRPSHGTTASAVAARSPAVEVRTQVIRRTIHIVRHENPAGLPRPRTPSAAARGGAGATRVASPAGPTLATRTSGSHATGSGVTGGPSAPVSTRSSGSTGAPPGASGPSGRPVSTRSSGSTGGSSSRPVTRTSGAGHGEGGDGGDGHGGGDN